MPDIRLQDYTTRIKNLIQDGLHDEAIAHCRQILRHYSRHIETYCLLGEACLEKGIYREAIEFFQRTLSADPENFIARVGLGIIYSEQGSLPEAIWQMERAFELAPGNAEVRRELQRLYAQRDGAEKARLKLNRGALGRLYSRNGLYDRAIGEFHAVLRHDPDLPDIRVALIEALWHEGRRLEAVEVCIDLLDALPNCLKANLILGEIWMRGGHEDVGEEKLNLAHSLDPENLVAQEMMGRDSPLPPEEVLIPELEAVTRGLGFVGFGEPEPAPAGWSLADEEGETEEGVLTREAEGWEAEEEVPDWLRDVGIIAGATVAHELQDREAVPAEPTGEEPAPDEPMPEWLHELMGDEMPPDVKAAVPSTTEPSLEEAVSAGEIPDWLREMQPEAEEAEEAAAPAAGVEVEEELIGEEEVPLAEEVPDWLREMQPEAEEAAAPAAGVEVEEELIGEEEVSLAEEVPDWLRELAPGVAGVAGAAALVAAVEVEEESIAEEEIPLAEEVPESLRALVEAGILDEADLDTAMAEMSPEELAAQAAEEVPGWLAELVDEEAAPADEEIAPLAAEVVAEEEPLVEEKAPLVEEIPDWLRELAPDVEEEEPSAEEVPDWLREMQPEAEEAEEAEEAAAPVTGVEVEEELIGEEEPSLAEEVPDWLREMQPEAEEAAAPVAGVEVEEELLAEEEFPVPEGIPESLWALVEAGILDEADLESAMAEMSSEDLEAQRAEEVPGWLAELIGEETMPPIEKAFPLVEAEGQLPVEAQAPPSEELPEWLRELEEPEVAEVASAEEVEPLTTGLPPAEVPESLKALVEAGILDEADLESAMAEMSPEELAAQAAEEVPEWLAELVDEEFAPAAEEEIEPAEEIPAWLQEFERIEEEEEVELVAEVPEEEVLLVEEAVEPVTEVLEEEVLLVEEEVEPVAEVLEEEVLLVEEEVEPVAEVLEEEVLLVEEEVEPVAEVPEEEVLPVEEEVEPVAEVPEEEVLPVEEELPGPSRIDELLELVGAKPRDYKARLELARLYTAEEDWDAALTHYEKLVSARKQLPSVLDDLEPLVEKGIDQARIYQLLGDAHMQQDHLDEALEMYRLARQALAQH